MRNFLSRWGLLSLLVRGYLVAAQSGDIQSLLDSCTSRLNAGDRAGAIADCGRALALARQAADRRGEASVLQRLGLLYGTTGEPRKAIELHRQSLTLYRAAGDRAGEAGVLIDLGGVHSTLAEAEAATEFLDQGLAIAREIGDRKKQGDALNQLGVIYGTRGENGPAAEFYQQALALRRAAGDRRGEAQTLSNLGVLHSELGERRRALEYFAVALPLRREAGNLQEQANTLHNMGVAYSRLGEYQKALDHFTQALGLCRATRARRGEAYALQNIADLHRQFGDAGKALDYYTQAVTLWREVGDRRGEALSHNALGLVYASSGAPARALESHRRALELYEAVGERRGQAQALDNMALLTESQGDRPEALRLFLRGLDLSRQGEDKQTEARLLRHLGGYYHQSGDQERAAAHFQDSLRLSREIEDRAGEARTLAALARLERDRRDLPQATRAMADSLRILESLRRNIAREDSRLSFFSTTRKYYEFLIDLLVDAGRSGEAFAASERARARSLLESLAEARSGIRQGADPALLDRERQLHELLNDKADRLSRLLAGRRRPDQEAEARKELQRLLDEYENLRARLRTTASRYASLTAPEPVALDELREVLTPDELVLAYWIGARRSILWAVSSDRAETHQLPGAAEFEPLVRRMREALETRGEGGLGPSLERIEARMAGADAAYRQAARRLGNLLLGPVAARLMRKRLVVLADGPLQYVSFAALPRPGSQGIEPLVARNEIFYAPSASVLALLRRQPKPPGAPLKTVAIFADPVYRGDDVRLRAVATRATPARALPRLRFSRLEAEHISTLVPPGQRWTALDLAASAEAVREQDLRSYRMVHFAAHALVDDVHPELSGIALSTVDAQGRPQDGFLRLHEIYNLRLDAQVVVLSACQTALGKDVLGEGLIGLTRGFLYAGARSVVASLWSVSDQATAELMKRFYQGVLERGLPPAAALRAAQISLSKDQRWNAPYYWAAFTVQGEP
jgi:CHAT domain-containing protein/Tfp pilus assembly protein PilF